MLYQFFLLQRAGVCVCDRRVMSQCGCGGSAEVSVSRVAWRKAEGGQYADGGHGEGVAMVAFSMNVVIVREIARSVAARKLRKASCAWGLTIPMRTKRGIRLR